MAISQPDPYHTRQYQVIWTSACEEDGREREYLRDNPNTRLLTPLFLTGSPLTVSGLPTFPAPAIAPTIPGSCGSPSSFLFRTNALLFSGYECSDSLFTS